MTTPTSTQTRSLSMGICLGAREVGLAVATRDRLVWYQTLNLRKLTTPEGRERRFVQVLSKLMDAYGATRLAVVELRTRFSNTTMLGVQRCAINELAATRDVGLAHYTPERVRGALVREARPTNRALAAALSARFPELLPKAPRPEVKLADGLSEALARRLRSLPAPRERYWRRMFLALAAALHDLDEELKLRLFKP